MHEPTEFEKYGHYQYKLPSIQYEARSIHFSAIFGLFRALENSIFSFFKICLFSCHNLATFNIEVVIKRVDFAINTNTTSNDELFKFNVGYPLSAHSMSHMP